MNKALAHTAGSSFSSEETPSLKRIPLSLQITERGADENTDGFGGYWHKRTFYYRKIESC